MAVEGLPREPWIVASSTRESLLLHPALPGTHVHPRTGRRKGSEDRHGRSSQAMRRHRHLQTRCQGLRARAGPAPRPVHLDGDHLGVDHQRGPGPAGSPAPRQGHAGGDGGDQRGLEAVLLPAGRRTQRAARQRPGRQEHARPQDRRLGFSMAGAVGRLRTREGVVRSARADPPPP